MTAVRVREAEKVLSSHRQLEGAGFIVRRPLPAPGLTALDPFLLERFVVVRNGREEGVYAGSPVATRLSDLFSPIGDKIPESVLVVDVFKDLPVGPSWRFVPRALAEESVDAMTIIETPRLRVLELRLRSQLADRVGGEEKGTGVVSRRRETRGPS